MSDKALAKTNSPSAERVDPHKQGSAGANAGGRNVDRSATRAPVEAGPENTSLAGGLESGIDHRFVDEPASGPDVKRAPYPEDIMKLAHAAATEAFGDLFDKDMDVEIFAAPIAVEREHAACLVEDIMERKIFAEHQYAKAALIFAARTIRRGRPLTSEEQFENIMRAIREPITDGEEA